MTDQSIDVEDVSHRYGSTEALKDVGFHVDAGSLTGLLGPNGSGKTTLFRLLATLLPVQSGRIRIFGHDVMTSAHDVRRKLGVTFQSPALDGRLTVAENLHCHGRLYGIDRPTLRQRIRTSLQRLEIEDRRNSCVEQLSGGLRRRVELAKGLLHAPEVLLLDEPSSGLDVAARRRFWDLVDSIRQSDGTTVIVSTHLMDEAERCDRLVLLHEGQLVRSGTPADLQRQIQGQRVTVHGRDVDVARRVMEHVLSVPVTVTGQRLTARVENAGDRIPQLISELGTSLLAVEVAQASLDDVFLDATGRSLTDSEPA